MTAQQSAESKGKRTPVVKFFRCGSLRVLLWGKMGALFVFLLFGCAFADDAYPEIPSS